MQRKAVEGHAGHVLRLQRLEEGEGARPRVEFGIEADGFVILLHLGLCVGRHIYNRLKKKTTNYLLVFGRLFCLLSLAVEMMLWTRPARAAETLPTIHMLRPV